MTALRWLRCASGTHPVSSGSPAHLLGDPEDARDAAQESLAKLCVRLRQFRGEAQFGRGCTGWS